MAFLKIKPFGGNLAAIKFGVSPPPVYVVYDRRIYWRRQILAKTRNSPNLPNIITRQNLLIYSIRRGAEAAIGENIKTVMFHMKKKCTCFGQYEHITVYRA